MAPPDGFVVSHPVLCDDPQYVGAGGKEPCTVPGRPPMTDILHSSVRLIDSFDGRPQIGGNPSHSLLRYWRSEYLLL
jgi:hypothetical protein